MAAVAPGPAGVPRPSLRDVARAVGVSHVTVSLALRGDGRIPGKRRAEIAEAIGTVDSGAGAIILTDLFGGTPSNLAISLLDAGRVEVIAGINLPMLIRLAGARKAMSVTDAVRAARDAGKSYITVASEFLSAGCGKKQAAS